MGKHAEPPGRRSLLARARSQALWLPADVREALVACVVGLLLVSVAPVLLGWKPTVVVSGSMMPRIRPGDVIVAAPASAHRVKPGIVVLVHDPAHPGELLMHRVVRFADASHFITKGDANPTADSTPVPLANVVGLPRIRVPWIGLPYLWIRQGRYLPVGAAAILLLALLFWRPSAPGGPPGRSTPSDGRRNLLSRPLDADPYPVRRLQNGPLDADPHRIRHRPSHALIRTTAALIGYSNPAALRPNWTPEAAAAVSTGDR